MKLNECKNHNILTIEWEYGNTTLPYTTLLTTCLACGFSTIQVWDCKGRIFVLRESSEITLMALKSRSFSAIELLNSKHS